MPNAVTSKLDTIREKTGISLRDVAELIATTPETISRWRSGRVDPQIDNIKKLATLAWLVDELSEFYEPMDAKLWLFSPQRLLGGDTPANRIAESRIEDVLALIRQLQDGAFV